MTDEEPIILVVEDDANARAIVSFVLEDAGYHVLEASGADQALSILDHHEGIDLVFSDIQMPGSMSGIGLAHYLHQRRQQLPVVLTSARPASYYEDFPSETPFLSKPYERRTLLTEIAKQLGHALH